MVLVSQASSLPEAIQQYRDHELDITLMEIRLPDLGGIDPLIAIRAEFPAARVIILTTCDGDMAVQRALKARASEYLHKTRLPASYCGKSEKYIGAASRLKRGFVRKTPLSEMKSTKPRCLNKLLELPPLCEVFSPA
jgi:DNA-binding NarL/FixJ family response regulator